MIKIGIPQASVINGKFICQSIITIGGVEQKMFFSVPAKYAEYADSKTCDAFLTAILFAAMKRGENIEVEGTVSEKLLFNIDKYAVKMLPFFDTSTKPVRVEARDTSSEIFSSSNGVGTGFSGGVDSFCTIVERFVRPMPAKYKIDRLFYFNVGSHGIPQSKADFDRIENKFATRYNSLKRYTDEVGLDFIPVDTNVHNFHPWGHLESSTFVSTSAALFMQPCIRRYYLSSSGHNYAQIMKFIGTGGEFKDLAMLDPMLLPMLSTETLDMIADGTELDRIEKTRIISTYEPTRRFLNVCAAKYTVDTNCSMCYKCCRTLLNLEILGKLEDYSQVFDLQKYRQVRANFIADTIVTRNEELYSLHLCEFAESQNYDLRAEISATDLMRAKLRRHNFYKSLRTNPVARAAFNFSEKLKK